MTKKKAAATRKYGNPVSWSDMCRTLRIFGFMNGGSKAEAFRVRKLLVKRIRQGKTEQIGRGLYRQIYR